MLADVVSVLTGDYRDEKLRILIVTGLWFPDVLGGLPRIATETARHLADRGHEITVIAPRHKRAPVREVFSGLKVFRVLPRTPLPVTATNVAFTAVATRRVAGPWHVAMAHSSTVATGLVWARLGVPLVRVYHASAVRELQFQRDRLPMGIERCGTYLLQPMLSAAETLSLRNAERVLTLSEFSRTLIASDHPWALARTVNVGGAVDTDAFSPGDGPAAARSRLGIDTEIQLVLTVRRLDHRMGLEVLLNAMSSSRVSSAVLAVAGVGTLEARLKRLAVDLGIAERVWFLGAVPDRQLTDWYRAADVFVLPTVAYEGFGVVTAEALASGTPVIGTPVGATPELLRPLDGGLVTKGTSAAHLADGIASVLARNGSDLRRRSRRYAVERLAWSKKIRLWETTLDEAACKR